MDEMILITQQWLNKTYEKRTGWNDIPENGKTGWTTVYALLIAFQIENGSETPAKTIGPWTRSKLDEVGGLKKNASANPSNLVKILQGTLWCKGYSADSLSGVFGDETDRGVRKLKTDIGIASTNSNLTTSIWIKLFSMDQFVLVPGGNSSIRAFQQDFNKNYMAYYSEYIPCDGLAGRELYTCFILTLQREEGYSSEVANGMFGPSTFRDCPTLSSSADSFTYPDTVRCIKLALYLNGFLSSNIDSTYIDSNLFYAIHQFNSFMILPDNGANSITPGTIKSLFTSNGDTDRPCNACDTATPINQSRADVLKAHNLKCVGRYLTSGIINGENKKLTISELDILKKNDIKVIPIYQTSGDVLEYFTANQGIEDGKNAILLAKNLRLPKDAVIYFAVDIDVQDGDIPGTILQYFNSIYKALKLNNNLYSVGIYGTRNVCNRVITAGYASSAYVSDMSSGYSGNMGFPMPIKWSFDQFHETTITHNGISLNVDKVASNGTNKGVFIDSNSNMALIEMAENFLDSVNMKPLLCNASIQINTKVNLLKGPIRLDFKLSNSLSTNVDGAFKITGKLNSDGSVATSVSQDIESITNSFEFDDKAKMNISTTVKNLITKFPDGTEIYVKISLNFTTKTLMIQLILNTQDYEYNGNKYKGSIELDITLDPSQMPPKYKYQLERALNYNKSQSFAMVFQLIADFSADVLEIAVSMLEAVIKPIAYTAIISGLIFVGMMILG